MSANEEFFRERKAQAVFKHGILSRYPVVFASKTGWGGRQVVFLDGYAGRGEYEDGSPGSPVLLARTAAKVGGFRDVTGIYVERSPADFRNLQQVMSQHGQSTDQLLEGDLRDRLPAILETARGAALFAFLDPFGTALDRDELAGQLLGRRDEAPTEVLLHISVTTVARIGGLLRRRREDGTALSAKDQKTVDHADRFLGGAWWRRHFEPVRNAADDQQATAAALRVAEEYRAGIGTATGCMSVSMPIRRRPNQFPKYLLVLFTRHMDGLWYFADALGSAGRDWEGAWRSEEDQLQRTKARITNAEKPGLFDVDDLLPEPKPFDAKEYEKDNRTFWEEIVKNNIRRVMESEGPFKLPHRLEQVYSTVLGAASERHVRAAVKALHADGIVQNTGIGREFYRELIRPTGSTSRAVG